jgi:hypothetical protein
MILKELHEALVREGLGSQPNDDDALAMMILLHTHRLLLSSGSLSDRPGVKEIAATTQRYAAETIASAWPDRSDTTRTAPAYWYYEFNTRTPFEVIDDITPPWDERVDRAKQRVLRNALVIGIDVED